jgi:hypothetical protein
MDEDLNDSPKRFEIHNWVSKINFVKLNRKLGDGCEAYYHPNAAAWLKWC